MKKALIVMVVLVSSLVFVWLLLPNNECNGEACQNSTSTNTEPIAKTAVRQAELRQATILDVRTSEEFSSQHVKQAINFGVELLKTGSMPDLAKDSKIYVYCRSGNRSTQAMDILKNNGFSNITDLGGLEDLKSAGVL